MILFQIGLFLCCNPMKYTKRSENKKIEDFCKQSRLALVLMTMQALQAYTGKSNTRFDFYQQDKTVLCILTSKWVLNMPFAGRNHLFGILTCVAIFFLSQMEEKKEKHKKKKK